MSRIGSLQRSIQKDADTSDMVYLTVLWRSVDFFVLKNWFLCTNAANDNTSVVVASFWILSKIVSLTPACVSNVHHVSLFPD